MKRKKLGMNLFDIKKSTSFILFSEEFVKTTHLIVQFWTSLRKIDKVSISKQQFLKPWWLLATESCPPHGLIAILARLLTFQHKKKKQGEAHNFPVLHKVKTYTLNDKRKPQISLKCSFRGWRGEKKQFAFPRSPL